VTVLKTQPTAADLTKVQKQDKKNEELLTRLGQELFGFQLVPFEQRCVTEIRRIQFLQSAIEVGAKQRKQRKKQK